MSPSRQVAALFVRRDSIYKTLEGVDCWDEDRDALKWPGGCPVVAHPPCGHWGRLSHFCKQPIEQKELAFWAIDAIRKHGGVFEHPSTSRIFTARAMAPREALPLRGERDSYGGFVVSILQWWFGHRAEKSTFLYIVGCQPKDLPEIPIKLGDAPCTISTSIRAGMPGKRPTLGKPEREHTPPDLARWLVEVARRCRPGTQTDGGRG